MNFNWIPTKNLQSALIKTATEQGALYRDLVRLDTNKLWVHRLRVCTLKCTWAVQTSCIVSVFWMNLKILLLCLTVKKIISYEGITDWFRNPAAPTSEHFCLVHTARKIMGASKSLLFPGWVWTDCLWTGHETHSRPALTSTWTSTKTNHVLLLFPSLKVDKMPHGKHMQELFPLFLSIKDCTTHFLRYKLLFASCFRVVLFMQLGHFNL